MLDIVPRCNPNGENLNFGPNLVPPNFFFVSFTPISKTLFQAIILNNLKEKLMNQTWENYEKPNSGPNFGLLGPHLCPKNFIRVFYVY